MQEEVLTVMQTVAKCKEMGFPCSEYSLRLWIKQGKIPVCRIRTKQLLYWPNVYAFITCTDRSCPDLNPQLSCKTHC